MKRKHRHYSQHSWQQAWLCKLHDVTLQIFAEQVKKPFELDLAELQQEATHEPGLEHSFPFIMEVHLMHLIVPMGQEKPLTSHYYLIMPETKAAPHQR